MVVYVFDGLTGLGMEIICLAWLNYIHVYSHFYVSVRDGKI